MEIREKEVLRYLNWTGQELDVKNENHLKNAISLGLSYAKPKYIYKKFKINFSQNIEVVGTNLILTGKDIKNHLKNCEYIYLLAATLGNEFDKQINIWQIKDLSFALYLEAVGTTLIEETCDEANDEINKIEKHTVSRFSCGYGDLPISIQPNILNILNTNRTIGLTCTNTNIMLPRKSVTAIIGIGENQEKIDPCQICNIRESCQRREKGILCGKHTQ